MNERTKALNHYLIIRPRPHWIRMWSKVDTGMFTPEQFGGYFRLVNNRQGFPHFLKRSFLALIRGF
jgi:hypothetical protein